VVDIIGDILIVEQWRRNQTCFSSFNTIYAVFCSFRHWMSNKPTIKLCHFLGERCFVFGVDVWLQLTLLMQTDW